MAEQMEQPHARFAHEGYKLVELKARGRYGKEPTVSKIVVPAECANLDDDTKAVIGKLCPVPFIFPLVFFLTLFPFRQVHQT
jgi:hypothetical protein